MSKLLYDERPIVAQASLIAAAGLNEALVLQQLHYLSLHSRSGSVDVSISELASDFPFWSERTVMRALLSLERQGFIATSRGTGSRNVYEVDYAVVEKVPILDRRRFKTGDRLSPPTGDKNAPEPVTKTARTGDKSEPVPLFPLYTQEKEIREKSGEKEARPRSLEDVVARFKEIGLDEREAEKFWSHGETIGWKVGKAGHPMKDWRAASITWKLRKEEDDAKRTNGTGRRSSAGGSTRADDLRESLDGALALSRRRGPDGADPRRRG